VARNRITDLFRRKTPGRLDDTGTGDDERLSWEEWLPSPDEGPETRYTRALLLDEIERAIEELPAAQRAVFVAHELEGRSFKELAAESGVSLNTLLSRKYHAVRRLRRRLRRLYDEFTKG
jgi:RNA polymerase sigma factor (sigma-70 family)